ncbi:hypothetical protein MANES_12G053501v8 [Manihot esculenta]|uniref:Uncharacterized protein n=2 Tax=Manihot esculenta TaxID=3983 RepID=A0ACB7GTG5_MANES|nr:hypothetical protein MANES_12G053501v8 [Manihot esculenta]
MGGKGRKRREKNYKAAHGGHTRLPPPPDHSQVDALPSKLHHIMSFTSHLLDGSAKPSKSTEEKRKRGGGNAEKKLPPENAITSKAIVDEGEDENLLTTQHSDDSDETVRSSNDEKRKKKRKRKRMQVIDLWFDTSMEKTKSKTEEDLDFPGHEQIKFGDVVQAPPKLVVVPKVLKNVPEASRERIRLHAIEEYRKHKGWTSRPRLKLPIVTETHPI